MKQSENQQRLYRIHAHLMGWFNQNKRDLPWRSTPREPYQVWISEIMLQQTQVETVIPYFEAWMARWPRVEDLAQASEDQVLKAWEGLGYYARARNILKAARLVTENYSGHLPDRYKDLLQLPGIGPYTAAAIASHCSGQVIGAVDANVLRVLSRLNQIEWTAGDPRSLKDCQKHLSLAMEELSKAPADAGRQHAPANPASSAINSGNADAFLDCGPDFQAGALNEALIELGALVCQAKTASCKLCPLNQDCLARAFDRMYAFPLPKDQIAKKEAYYSPLILYQEGLNAFAVEQRPSEGLLGGLWQFPMLEALLTEEEITSYLEARGYKVLSLHKLDAYRHTFSHLVWNLQPYIAVLSKKQHSNLVLAEETILEDGQDSVQWIAANELQNLAFSSSMTRLRDLVIQKGHDI